MGDPVLHFLAGPNGAGKSTMFARAGRTRDPSAMCQRCLARRGALGCGRRVARVRGFSRGGGAPHGADRTPRLVRHRDRLLARTRARADPRRTTPRVPGLSPRRDDPRRPDRADASRCAYARAATTCPNTRSASALTGCGPSSPKPSRWPTRHASQQCRSLRPDRLLPAGPSHRPTGLAEVDTRRPAGGGEDLTASMATPEVSEHLVI